MSSRLVVSAAALGVVGSVVLLGGPAGASVTKGDPQPELKPFTLATHDGDGGGSVAILGNGTLLAAYTVKTADGRGGVKVCILPRAGTACSSTSPTIAPPAGASNDATGVPQVFVADKTRVYLLTGNTDSGAALYTSTNSGVTFGSPVSLGDLGVSSAALVGSEIVFSPSNGLDGSTVASVNIDSPTKPASVATPSTLESESIGDGAYKGGALVANDNFGDAVVVDYAPSGQNFNATSSYRSVGKFTNEHLLGLSDGALLTQSEAGSDPVRLRLFNGTSFGAAHVVPKAEGAGPESYVIVESPGGGVHVFTILAKNGYELDEESTSTGASWSGPSRLSDAEVSSNFNGGLDATGSGIILGTTAGSLSVSRATAYPVLAPQHVTFALSRSSIKRGKKVVASGRTTPAKKGRRVTLEYLKKGLWHSVATTTEGATGRFSFTLKDKTAGAFTFRAVGADTKGYVQFGYSSSRGLHVVVPKK